MRIYRLEERSESKATSRVGQPLCFSKHKGKVFLQCKDVCRKIFSF